MPRISGITVRLIPQVDTGVRDELDAPILADGTPILVENVLIAPSSSAEILDSINLTGRKAVYTLGIPKGDTNEWEDQIVEFFGQRWKVIQFPLEGLDDLIPLSWNKKVMVERYD